MQKTYDTLKDRWLSGERDRELGLQLMFFAWMHWADPHFVTGLEDDPIAARLWLDIFEYLGGEQSDDTELLFVAGIMAELFPWMLGDEAEWEERGLRMQARAKAVQPSTLTLSMFDGRGEYGEYFAHQLNGAMRRTRI